MKTKEDVLIENNIPHLIRITYKRGLCSSLGNIFLPDADLVIERFEIKKETKCGYWIDFGYKLKWVSKTGNNVFARITEKEALKDFIIKKKKQIKIMKNNIKVIEVALRLAEIKKEEI